MGDKRRADRPSGISILPPIRVLTDARMCVWKEKKGIIRLDYDRGQRHRRSRTERERGKRKMYVKCVWGWGAEVSYKTRVKKGKNWGEVKRECKT